MQLADLELDMGMQSALGWTLSASSDSLRCSQHEIAIHMPIPTHYNSLITSHLVISRWISLEFRNSDSKAGHSISSKWIEINSYRD